MKRAESQAALNAAAEAQKKASAQDDLNAELFAVLRKGAQLKKSAPPPQKPAEKKPAEPHQLVVLRKTQQQQQQQPKQQQQQKAQQQRSYRKSVRLDELMLELGK